MQYKSLFPLLMDIDPQEIPIFIPTFNQPSLLELTLKQLSSRDETGRIVIYDNNSTYSPMIELLESLSSKYDVVKSDFNVGPRIFTEDLHILELMPEYYIVTDPDLIYNPNLPKNYISEMKNVISNKNLAKVGFAIEIYDQDERDRFSDPERVQLWEESYWQSKIGMTSTKDPIYDAWIDTTFSLNKKSSCIYHHKFKKPTFRYPSARIAGAYTCQHVGWWKKEIIPQTSDEINYYLNNELWSHTERYYYK